MITLPVRPLLRQASKRNLRRTLALSALAAIVLMSVFSWALMAHLNVQPTVATTSIQVPLTTPTFKQLTGSHFTIRYPANWKKSHVSQPGGGQSGSDTPSTQIADIYAFVAQDHLTGLHILHNVDEQAVDGTIIGVVGSAGTCNTTPVMSQVTVGGVIWSQAEVVCLIAGRAYEARELNTGTPYGTIVIMYGAYQQVVPGAVVPGFIQANNVYFKPMLASFKFSS